MQKIILFTNKVYINIKLDFLWLFTKQEFYLKFKYYFSKYYNIFFDKKSIQYLGEEFYYDNRFTPALLQSYPLEINNISKIIDFDNLDSVLDIGGNLGQFSISLNHYYRNLKINSFEPNTEAFNLYKKNVVNKKNIQVHNVGIGPKDEELNFFYVKGKSGQGSIYEENSKEGLLSDDTIKTKIKIINFNKKNLESYGIEKYYDFIKIDVEGFELNVLQGLKDIGFRYLYMELSVDRVGSNLEEVKELLNKNYPKDLHVLYLGKNKGTTRDVIFELI